MNHFFRKSYGGWNSVANARKEWRYPGVDGLVYTSLTSPIERPRLTWVWATVDQNGAQTNASGDSCCEEKIVRPALTGKVLLHQSLGLWEKPQPAGQPDENWRHFLYGTINDDFGPGN